MAHKEAQVALLNVMQKEVTRIVLFEEWDSEFHIFVKQMRAQNRGRPDVKAPESAAKESRRMTIWMRAPTARRARTGRSFVRRFASRTTASAIRRRHQLARAAARTPARAALRPAGRE